MKRVILHSDLNSFYASVECQYNPELRDKPVAVGGSVEHRHGILLTANIIAKKGYGLKVGEALWQSKQKCPNLVIVPPNYKLYLRISKEVREIYQCYTDKVEAFGIDENWLDVTESAKLYGSGEKIAHEIKDRIKSEIGITASVGCSYNKIFAKLGSDLKKPDAVTVINEENFKQLVWPLPVEELLYVGHSTKKKLNRVAIYKIGDLANASPRFLRSQLGKWGETLWYFANGMDDTPVSNNDYQSIIKGIGNSMTTSRDLLNNEDVKLTVYVLCESVAERLRKHTFKANTIQVYIRDNELFSIERQAKLFAASQVTPDIAKKAMEIFLANWSWDKPIRSLGVRASDLITADSCVQLSLFEDCNRQFKLELLETAIDGLRGRFGHYSIQRAILLKDKGLNGNPVEDNIIHPVSFFR